MGISYAVVTKVKELTEAKQYGEAMDLLEGEDIFQSFNPQFLRCCGKVYMENGLYYESREALVRAHIMAPEGNRIVYDLVHLYLRMGYFQRAKQYYDIYEYYATSEDTGAKFLQYMIQKARRVEASELLEILESACEEQYSDEWGFELALLYATLGMQDKKKEECIRLMATFRNSPYCALAEALKKGEYDVNNSNFRFPIMEAEEDVETYASILALEEKQLEKDELKVHPPTPVILQMEDDDEPEEESQGLKERVKKFKLPFGKKRGKSADSETAEGVSEELQAVRKEGEAEGDYPGTEETQQAMQQVEQTSMESTVEAQTNQEADKEVKQEENVRQETEFESENVSSYIESVMKSVAEIEASVAEDLEQPLSFVENASSVSSRKEQNNVSATENKTEKVYQPKLFDVEENLSPKERLEQLMRLIEEDRQNDAVKDDKTEPEEELDMDEFLMNLVGANSITQAMVKNYRSEMETGESSDSETNEI